MSPDSRHRQIVREFADRIATEYTDSVAEVVLYGSVARDEGTAESDVDLLVILSDDADADTAEDAVREAAYDLELTYGVVLSLIVLTEPEYERRSDRVFYRTVRSEGEQLYG